MTKNCNKHQAAVVCFIIKLTLNSVFIWFRWDGRKLYIMQISKIQNFLPVVNTQITHNYLNILKHQQAKCNFLKSRKLEVYRVVNFFFICLFYNCLEFNIFRIDYVIGAKFKIKNKKNMIKFNISTAFFLYKDSLLLCSVI